MNTIIVEDEGITAFYLKESLSNLGYQIKGVFDNAKTTLEFLSSEQIDIIFMDINIKGSMDGIQLAKHIHTLNKKIQFVFVTSYKDSQTIQEVQIVKPLGYLTKPITESDLEIIVMIIHGQNECKKEIECEDLRFQNLKYIFEEKVLYKNGNLVHLSLKEKICFKLLLKHKNNYISTENLIHALWEDSKNRENSLRELVFRLRKKITPLSIVSTPNVGYSLIIKN